MALIPKGFSLTDLSESAKQKVAMEIKKKVESEVKKELAKRRRKFALRLVAMGVTFAVGCAVYAFSDRIVDIAADMAFDRAINGKTRRNTDSGTKRR